MQARAIFEAVALTQKEGISVLPEIMIPLVMTRRKLQLMHDIISRCRRSRKRMGQKIVVTLSAR